MKNSSVSVCERGLIEQYIALPVVQEAKEGFKAGMAFITILSHYYPHSELTEALIYETMFREGSDEYVFSKVNKYSEENGQNRNGWEFYKLFTAVQDLINGVVPEWMEDEEEEEGDPDQDEVEQSAGLFKTEDFHNILILDSYLNLPGVQKWKKDQRHAIAFVAIMVHYRPDHSLTKKLVELMKVSPVESVSARIAIAVDQYCDEFGPNGGWELFNLLSDLRAVSYGDFEHLEEMKLNNFKEWKELWDQRQALAEAKAKREKEEFEKKFAEKVEEEAEWVAKSGSCHSLSTFFSPESKTLETALFYGGFLRRTGDLVTLMEPNLKEGNWSMNLIPSGASVGIRITAFTIEGLKLKAFNVVKNFYRDSTRPSK